MWVPTILTMWPWLWSLIYFKRTFTLYLGQENHHTSNDIVRQSAMIVQNEAILKSPLLGNHFKGPADIHPQRTQTSSVASKPETPKKPHSTTKDGHRTKTPWTPHSADTRTPSSTVSIQRRTNNNLNTTCQPLAQLLNIRYTLTLKFYVFKYMSTYLITSKIFT